MIPPGPGIRSYLLPHLQDKKPKEPGLDLFLALLGLDFGHEPDYKRVLDQDKHPLTDVMWVEQNSGIMNVVPAWKILELLNSSETIAMREDREQTLYEHAGRS